MTLRNKTLLFISITLVVLIVALYTFSRAIVQGGFRKVEKDLSKGFSSVEDSDARRNVSRVVDALNQKIDNLSIKASDWAQWDDTYAFVQDRNNAYIESNLELSSVLNLKINYIIIIDGKGEMAAGIGLDIEKEAALPLSDDLKTLLKPGSSLLNHDSLNDVKTGVLMLKENPLMFASRPILTSDGTGPIRGTLIFARYLDDVEIGALSSVTHLTLTRYRIDAKMPEDFIKAKTLFSGPAPIIINPLDEETISGYTEISDYFKNPAMVLRVDIQRDIHKQGQYTISEIRKRGQVTLWSLIISILLSGIVLGIVIIVILEKLVLSRIGRLSRKTVEIGRTGDFTARVEEEGKDEIYSLSASINKMLGSLSQAHESIEARNAEMRLLMNTLPAGLLSIDENFNVNPEYSLSALKMLNQKELHGKPFAEVIGLTGAHAGDAEKLLDYLDMVRRELASESTLAELNPFDEINMSGTEGEKWLRLRFFLIRRQEKIPHLLVVIEDITEAKRLSQEVDKSHKENLQLKAIAEDPDLFREFLMETRKILKENHALSTRLSTALTDLSPIHEIFRNVHTIKGVAGSFGLFQVAGVAGELEERLETARNGSRLEEDTIRETRDYLTKLQASFDEVVMSARKILGDDTDGGTGIFLRIPLDELKKYIQEIRDMGIDESFKDKMIGKIRDEILGRLRKLTTVPARKGLARSVKIVPGLIERLGKNVRFQFDGQETALDCEAAHELNTALIHLIRNAFDHGIEPLEERLEKGKPEEGVVTLSVGRENGTARITLSDDGAGLDPEKIKTIALKKGFITQDELKFLTRERTFAILFRPGFSTAEQVSDVSGRGVGLDAVLQSIRGKLKGEIEVDSKPGEGTRFTIKIPV